MRGGVILIALALVIAYLGVTGRYKCFSVFFNCVVDPGTVGCPCSGGGSGAGSGGAIIVTPGGNSGVNPTGAPIYDARDPAPIPLLPIEPFV